MANSLYNELSQQTQPNVVAQIVQEIVQEAKRFKQTFKGNPRSEVERLLSTGQMSQQEFNQLSQIMTQIMTSNELIQKFGAQFF